MGEHPRARVARKRIAQDVDELVLATALALGSHGGERQVRHEEEGHGRRERERGELQGAVLLRDRSGEEHGSQLRDSGRERSRRRGAEREEASDHRQPAGERDRLPEGESDRGRA